MKKVLIIGAAGSLAEYVIEGSKHLENTSLTLFVRNKNKLSKELSDSCEVIEGDAQRYEDIKNAVKGKDIVYINLAGDLETMTGNIIKAMQEEHVRRVIAISSIGIYDQPLRSVLAPYRKLADLIESSGLDYTILRPDWFTNADEIEYAITRKNEPESGTAVSRKSIAHFVTRLIHEPDLYIHENLGISRPD
ncbi:NAD(P)H-binding protein [Chryseobacterium sp. SIMBA_029]|uniref:NAD(P)H-binding protein n=1 Tax=Chryseobacterium sp. SIMBA_029 TaxID=3085772 RepID=UPI00397D596C